MDLQKYNQQLWKNPFLRVDSLYQRVFKTTYKHFKTLFDVMIACISIIVLSPIILLFTILIVFETPGSPFFIQERLGYKGKVFKIIKLRSMTQDAEKTGAQWAVKNDPRVTRVGTIIRKLRIDEIPQLINVIKGEMSLIGPRPERLIFTVQFTEEIPEFRTRLSVKPGITGWAQINGGYDLSPREKYELDCFYIKHISPLLDLKILLKTVKVCLTGYGAR